LIVEDWTEHAPTTRTGEVTLEAGRSYDLKFEYFEGRIGAVAKLVWQPPAPQTTGSPYAEALDVAKQADAVVLVLGISAQLEGEEMNVTEPGFAGGDRTNINLPARQEGLLKAVAATGKPVVLVLLSGSALAVNWADAHVPAVVQAWYPGEEGGAALADVLFGDYNPAGRLPVTFYKSAEQLPPFDDYKMEGRTYRYFKGDPLYPFGYGLSYTTFKYDGLKFGSKRYAAGRNVELSVEVQNTGARAGDEVVQLYVSDAEASAPAPRRALKGVRRLHLKPGERRRVSFTLTPRDLSLVDERGRRLLEPGEFRVSVGGKQPGFHGPADAATTGVVGGSLTVTGKSVEIP
jgi:beta-glucosidase